MGAMTYDHEPGGFRADVDGAVTDGHAELASLFGDMPLLVMGKGLPGGVDLPKPYATTIVLVDRTYLIGGRGFDGSGADAGMVDSLRRAGESPRIQLRRVPDDAEDPWTVEALLTETPIGFVRAYENEIIARLMDAGKHVYAEYLETETLGEYHRVWIRLVMDD